jgi:hypothetical protein
VVDVMAGIGPFAIPAALRDCKVNKPYLFVLCAHLCMCVRGGGGGVGVGVWLRVCTRTGAPFCVPVEGKDVAREKEVRRRGEGERLLASPILLLVSLFPGSPCHVGVHCPFLR